MGKTQQTKYIDLGQAQTKKRNLYAAKIIFVQLNTVFKVVK